MRSKSTFTNSNTMVLISGMSQSNSLRASVSVGLPDQENTHAVGFIDGDFVERFLEFGPHSTLAAQALQGRNSAEILKGQDFESVVQALEQLQLVH